MANILVVDDSKLIRLQLKNMIEDIGHNVIAEAEDGDIAYEMYKEHNPDIVTMDINMPKLSGLGAVEKIINDFPDAMIIMISSIEDRSITYECIGKGAMDFINKPIHIEELKTKINSLL